MKCSDVRTALSAALDGEPAGVPTAQVTAHLAGCPECAAWQARAAEATRQVALGPAEVPDLTEGVLAALNADPRVAAARAAARRRQAPDPDGGRRQILRVAVAVMAVAQLLLAVPVLFGIGGPHAGREMASFDIALAVGFGLAAWRPEWARPFVPVAGVLAACLSLTSGMDMLNSSIAFAHETGHLVAVVQAGLLWALSKSPRRGRPVTA